MLETVFGYCLVSLSVLISAFYIKRFLAVTIENQKVYIKNEVETWLNSEKGQKALFQIGAIIGNGAKAGIGLESRGGKFKLQDLIGQIAMQYFTGNQGVFGQGQESPKPDRKQLATLPKA